MRIAIGMLTLTAGKGGAERVAADLCNELVRRGHAVLLHCGGGEGAKPAYPVDSSVKLICTPLTGGKVKEIRSQILSWQPDLYFFFYFTYHNLVGQFSVTEGTGIPVGAQECSSPANIVRNLSRSPWLGNVHAAIRTREAIHAGLHGIRLTLPSYLDSISEIAKPSVRVFPNAFPVAERRSQPGKTDGIKTILNVGGLKSPNKNGLALARAFTSIASEFPDWQVRYIGRVGKAMEPLVTAALHKAANVTLVGPTDRPYDEYAQAQIHAICSYVEGLPNVVCEAMLHGLPSIGYSDCSGTNELIRHDENGLLVSRTRGDNDLAQALRELMSDADRRVRLGGNAFNDAQALFRHSAIYDQWESLLRQIASYAGDTDRLYRERSALNPDAVERARHVRNLNVANFAASDVNPRSVKRVARETKLSPAFSIVARPVCPKLSIIVPVYNKSQYVGETVQSILDDDYPNRQIVLVDDCSTDDSLAILRSFETSNDAVSVITREANGGLSVARNTGLAAATGEFVHFWDADDLYSKGAMARLVTTMIEDNSDIATGLASRNGNVLQWYQAGNRLKRGADYLSTPEVFSTNSSCFKLYRADFLRRWGLQFVPGLYVQDMEFNFRAFVRADRITMTPLVIGEYRDLPNSGSSIINSARIESTFRIEELTRRFIVSNGLDAYERLREWHVLKFVWLFFIKRLMSGESGLKPPEAQIYLERYRKAMPGLREGVLELLGTDTKVGLGLVALSSGLFPLAHRLLNTVDLHADCSSLLANNPFGISARALEGYIALVRRTAAA